MWPKTISSAGANGAQQAQRLSALWRVRVCACVCTASAFPRVHRHRHAAHFYDQSARAHSRFTYVNALSTQVTANLWMNRMKQKIGFMNTSRLGLILWCCSMWSLNVTFCRLISMNFTLNLHVICWYSQTNYRLITHCGYLHSVKTCNNHILEFCQGQEVCRGAALRYAAESGDATERFSSQALVFVCLSSLS